MVGEGGCPIISVVSLWTHVNKKRRTRISGLFIFKTTSSKSLLQDVGLNNEKGILQNRRLLR